jgi:hydrogenase maturation factor HypE
MSELIERLLSAPADVNAAIRMSAEIKCLALAGELTPEKIAEMAPRIDQAADQGESDLQAVRSVLDALEGVEASAAAEVPFGF